MSHLCHSAPNLVMTDFSLQTVSSCGGGSVAHMTDCKSHLQKYSVNSNREFPAAPSVISRLVVKPDKPTKCFTTRISLETFVSLIWTGDVTGLINSLHESEREMSGLAESAENPAISPGRALSTLLRPLYYLLGRNRINPWPQFIITNRETKLDNCIGLD